MADKPTADFEGQVLGTLDTIGKKQDTIQTEFKTAQEKIMADYSRLETKTKEAFEELTRVKNSCNDIPKIEAEIAKVRGLVNREANSAFGDPLQRLVRNPEFNAYTNWLFRSRMPAEAGQCPDLTQWESKFPDSWKRGAITGGDSSLGAALMPSEVFGEVYSLLSRYGIWNTFGRVPVGARTTTMPLQTVAPIAYFYGGSVTTYVEGYAITEATLSGTSVTLTIQTIAALLGVTRESIQDSTVDLTSFVMDALANAIAYRLDWACLAADGTADQTDGAYTGLFAIGGTNTNMVATAGDGNTTTALTDLEDWVRCLTTVSTNVLTRPCRWWMHPTILAQAMLVRDANDRPMFQTATEAPSPGAIGRILGYPVTLGDACPSTDAASAKVAAFGDPQGLAVGIRQDVEMASSAEYRFNQNQIVYRALLRAGSIIKQSSTYAKPFAILTLPAA